jgi:hypothetical protein
MERALRSSRKRNQSTGRTIRCTRSSIGRSVLHDPRFSETGSMLLHLVVFIGGLLTILGPCIADSADGVRALRPVTGSRAPAVARGTRADLRSRCEVATASATWIARANEIGRWSAIVLLGVLGLSLVSSRVAAVVARPVVSLGARLDAHAARAQARSRVRRWFGDRSPVGPVPGPILGLVVAGAVARGGGLARHHCFSRTRPARRRRWYWCSLEAVAWLPACAGRMVPIGSCGRRSAH